MPLYRQDRQQALGSTAHARLRAEHTAAGKDSVTYMLLLNCRGFVLAGLADMHKPPEKLSPNMTGGTCDL